MLSRSVLAEPAPSAPLAGTSRLHRRAAYTRCLRCAGAPRRPASGSGLSLPFRPDMPSSLTPGSSTSHVSSVAMPTRPSPRSERLGTPKTPAIRFTRDLVFEASLVRQLLRPVRLLAPLELGRIAARTGLRMMPTFPRSPRSFRTAGFPQYGWEAGLSGGGLPHGTGVKPLPAR